MSNVKPQNPQLPRDAYEKAAFRAVVLASGEMRVHIGLVAGAAYERHALVWEDLTRSLIGEPFNFARSRPELNVSTTVGPGCICPIADCRVWTGNPRKQTRFAIASGNRNS